MPRRRRRRRPRRWTPAAPVARVLFVRRWRRLAPLVVAQQAAEDPGPVRADVPALGPYHQHIAVRPRHQMAICPRGRKLGQEREGRESRQVGKVGRCAISLFTSKSGHQGIHRVGNPAVGEDNGGDAPSRQLCKCSPDDIRAQDEEQRQDVLGEFPLWLDRRLLVGMVTDVGVLVRVFWRQFQQFLQGNGHYRCVIYFQEMSMGAIALTGNDDTRRDLGDAS